jgi:hypothetical protein
MTEKYISSQGLLIQSVHLLLLIRLQAKKPFLKYYLCVRNIKYLQSQTNIYNYCGRDMDLWLVFKQLFRQLTIIIRNQLVTCHAMVYPLNFNFKCRFELFNFKGYTIAWHVTNWFLIIIVNCRNNCLKTSHKSISLPQ